METVLPTWVNTSEETELLYAEAEGYSASAFVLSKEATVRKFLAAKAAAGKFYPVCSKLCSVTRIIHR
jgi:hypothetical protein